MITYNHAPKGGLGNRLFQLNFIGQLANLLETEFSFYSPNDSSYFHNISSSKLRRLQGRFLKKIKLSEETQLDAASISSYFRKRTNLGDFSITGSYLGETFFKCSAISPREIVRHKFGQINNQEQIACHFRGGDFRTWNPKSILKMDYYLQAIEYIDTRIGNPLPIKLVTDELGLESVQKIAKIHRGRVELISNKNPIEDLKSLMASNYLVSSPSTFAIWAGILSDKKEIIHSAEWVEERASLNDKFWEDLKSGGNSYYKASQLI
jgi:hypothetical protein